MELLETLQRSFSLLRNSEEVKNKTHLGVYVLWHHTENLLPCNSVRERVIYQRIWDNGLKNKTCLETSGFLSYLVFS